MTDPPRYDENFWPWKVDGPTFAVQPDPEAGGYVAQCVERPGATGQGATVAEAIADARSALADLLAFEKGGGK